MEYVKAGGKTQSQLDTEAAEQEAEREQNEAIATIKDHQKTLARLTLAMTQILWPKLSSDERPQIRDALSPAEEQIIRNALTKLEAT